MIVIKSRLSLQKMDLGPLMKSVRTDAFMMSVELLTFENISET